MRNSGLNPVERIYFHILQTIGAQVIQQEVYGPEQIGCDPSVVAVRVKQEKGGYISQHKEYGYDSQESVFKPGEVFLFLETLSFTQPSAHPNDDVLKSS